MFRAKAVKGVIPPAATIPIRGIFGSHDEPNSRGQEAPVSPGPISSTGKGFRAVLSRLRKQNPPGCIHVENFLHRLYQRQIRLSTIQLYDAGIRSFLSCLQKYNRTDLVEITRHDVGAFIEEEQDRGLRASTIQCHLDLIYAFLRYLVEVGVANPDVMDRKLRVKKPELLPRAIPAEDIRLFLAAVDHVRDRALFLLLLRTGLRVGELLGLKGTDINLREKKIMIYEAMKTRSGRTVYFSPDALDALGAWLKERDQNRVYIFYGHGQNSLSYAAARLRFVKYMEKAGLSYKGYTVHCLRHTYATELLNAGMRLECLQQLLGHINIEVTRRYARLSDQTREEEYFRAMSIIERRGRDDDQLDRELAAILEEKELLETHS